MSLAKYVNAPSLFYNNPVLVIAKISCPEPISRRLLPSQNRFFSIRQAPLLPGLLCEVLIP
jgi:hypothetical protein